MLLTTIHRPIALVVFLAVRTWAAEAITGTVYADLGGSGGGFVRIATDRCLFDLDYSSGYRRNFSADSCREIGAKWVVEVDITHPGRGVLRSARCAGQLDERIHAAWVVATRYLDLLSSQSYSAASKLVANGAGEVFDPTNPRDLDAGAFALIGGHGMCISVSIKEDEDHVVFRAEDACGIKMAGRPVHVLIHVLHEGSPSEWRVGGVSAFY